MRRRRRALTTGVDEEATINLTPLIDVVFVVLIMFMVIAPLLDLDQVALAPGKAGGTKTVERGGPIAIHVHQDNTIWVSGKQIALANLQGWLNQAHAAHPTVKPQIFHDKRALFGTYQEVKNSVEAAGFEEMEVILEPS